MRAASSSVCEETLRGLETGLHVRHIALFGLVTCKADDLVGEVRRSMSPQVIDHVPVKRGRKIVGVLHLKTTSDDGDAGSQMKAFREVRLVAAETPLITYLREAGNTPYALVHTGQGACGIVTRSDLQKLPVRLLAFAVITHLEMQMADVMRLVYPSPSKKWLSTLTKKRESDLVERWEKLGANSEDVDLIEASEFCDKRKVVGRLALWGREQVTGFKRELVGIEKLRNGLAHANNFGFDACIARVLAAEKWISLFDILKSECGTRDELLARAESSQRERNP
jgi:hypothetical protein